MFHLQELNYKYIYFEVLFPAEPGFSSNYGAENSFLSLLSFFLNKSILILIVLITTNNHLTINRLTIGLDNVLSHTRFRPRSPTFLTKQSPKRKEIEKRNKRDRYLKEIHLSQ